MSGVETSEHTDKRRDLIEKRYSNIGWAIFLILAGTVMLLPDALVPEGFMWIAAGVIMLGYRGAVAARGIDASVTLVFAGIAMIAIGVSGIINLDINVFPLLLIVGGIMLLGRAMTSRED